MPENRRVRMTKGFIRDAYVDFVEENPNATPSVTEICERADVNRSTFYTHYKDIDALRVEIEDMVFENVPVLFPEDDPDYIEKNRILLEEFFCYIAENPRMLSVVASASGDVGRDYRLTEILFRDFRPEGVNRDGSVAYFEYLFCVMGALNAVREWHREGQPINPRAFGYLIFECCRKAMTDSPDLSKIDRPSENLLGGYFRPKDARRKREGF